MLIFHMKRMNMKNKNRNKNKHGMMMIHQKMTKFLKENMKIKIVHINIKKEDQ